MPSPPRLTHTSLPERSWGNQSRQRGPLAREMLIRGATSVAVWRAPRRRWWGKRVTSNHKWISIINKAAANKIWGASKMTTPLKCHLTTGDPIQISTIMGAWVSTCINHQKLEAEFKIATKGHCHRIICEIAISRTLSTHQLGRHPANPTFKSSKPAGAIETPTISTAANPQWDLSTRVKSRTRRSSFTIAQKFQKRRTSPSLPSKVTASATSPQAILICRRVHSVRSLPCRRTFILICRIWTPRWSRITICQTLRPN